MAARDTLEANATLNWGADIPITDWDGVTVEGDPARVTRLALPGYRYGLSGSIPAELGHLTNLRELWLGDGNKLSGEIPSDLARLTRLAILDLGLNELSGGIPMWLGDLSDLRLVYLDGNQLIGEIPAGLGNLANLELLTLDNNHGLMGTLPQSMTRLTAIGTFGFSNTGLCAPLDERFQAWLLKIPDYEGPDCLPEPTTTVTPTPPPTATPTPTATLADLGVNVAITTDDYGTAWVFSYPDLPEALWFENEVYLPAHTNVQFVISAFDEAPHLITADELFKTFELVQNARGVVLGFETSGEQYVLGKAHESQIPFHILPREEFEQVITSKEGCANGVVIPDPQTKPGAVRDCRVLLQMRDTLVGDGKPLNWDVGTPYSEWEGTWWISLPRHGLDGVLYPIFRLRVLDLAGRGLAGCVPDALMKIQVDYQTGGLPFCDDTSSGASLLDSERNFRLVFKAPLSEEKMQEDMRSAQHAFDRVFELYGRRPDKHVDLEFRDDGLYHWPYTIPFHFEWKTYTPVPALEFAVHEVAHFYTAELLRVDSSWLKEGLSMVAQLAERAQIPFDDFNFSNSLPENPCPDLREDYKRLKDGYNIYKEVFYCGRPGGSYSYMRAPHIPGMLFFTALSLDYSINAAKLIEFMEALAELSRNGRMTEMDVLRAAVMQVAGKDIMRLLRSMEPVIVFDPSANHTTRKHVEMFFEENPQYGTDEVSWITLTPTPVVGP